jgi:N-acetylglutamate synthase-like GNAT family acetyltransferase
MPATAMTYSLIPMRLNCRSIGRSLLEHSAQIARTQGSSALHVVGNPHAEAFYLACGFQLIGTAETRFGPGLLLPKLL